MRSLSAILLILLFGTLIHLYLPWWTIAILCFIIGLAINRTWWSAFLSGFIGVGILWLGMSVYQTVGNGGVLVERIAGVMELPNKYLLYLATTLIGALVGGSSSLSGYMLKHTEKKKRKNKYHV